MFDDTSLAAWRKGLKRELSLPVRIELWDGRCVDLSAEAPRVTIRVPSPSSLRYLRSPSLYKLGRAYVEGALEIRGRAADMICIGSELSASSGKPARHRNRMWQLPAHRRASDAAAIHYHYDVSNDFYAAWLDPAMVYSCAYFESGDEDLATAQSKKIDHILRKIDLRPGQTLLDIGCGWGALVLRAAQAFGARCVGITLSENQARLARERVAQAGLTEKIEIRLQDYRDVDGQFDRITSVGMVEHVGTRQLPAYFARVCRLLAPGGVLMNHGITTTDVAERAAPYGGGEFILEYVFPQGELAHLSAVVKAMQEGGLEVRDVENLRRHYARTCALWIENFEDRAPEIATLTDGRHFRIWKIYLAGCAYAFAHDWISLYQVVCGKAGEDPGAIPWSRKYMYP
jgi:cyclopropane-fatty-acyl-phospholipid synthase